MEEVDHMPWTYEYKPGLRVVDVVYVGDITPQDLQESTSACIRLEKEKGLNQFLVDAQDMKLASPLVEFYNLPAQQYLEEEADRQGRVAVVLPTDPNAKEAALLYETACRNRGWMVRVFAERRAAVDWLTRGSTSSKPDSDSSS